MDITEELVDRITTSVAEKIKALNGDKSVSATFVVGGGRKDSRFYGYVSGQIRTSAERVALRGEEYYRKSHFEQTDIPERIRC